MNHSPIDNSDWENRRKKLEVILSSIADHALIQSSFRCPYKNKNYHCTAKFGCRNQQKNNEDNSKLLCVGDDKLDYRSAWQSQPLSFENIKTQRIH